MVLSRQTDDEGEVADVAVGVDSIFDTHVENYTTQRATMSGCMGHTYVMTVAVPDYSAQGLFF